MAEPLRTSEIATLLALMAQAREMSNVDLKERYGFTLTGAAKTRLNEAKLVISRKVGRAFVHELTDQGWARCVEELAAPCPPRAGAAGGALYALLHGLRRYLDRAQLSLSDVFRESTVDPESAVRAAYARAARRPAGWVALTDLRPLLADRSRAEVDDALTRLNRQPMVSLIPEENQKVLTAADREAAVIVSGRPYHFLLIEGA
jgi:hypothetical protein